VFERCYEYVLALAAYKGYNILVLGAWGCGVLRNDPEIMAMAFATHLRGGSWFGRFDDVVFFGPRSRRFNARSRKSEDSNVGS
jgi:uncharacterized protein (TIGR02452 family)